MPDKDYYFSTIFIFSFLPFWLTVVIIAMFLRRFANWVDATDEKVMKKIRSKDYYKNEPPLQ